MEIPPSIAGTNRRDVLLADVMTTMTAGLPAEAWALQSKNRDQLELSNHV
jgi:hypothetical protein